MNSLVYLYSSCNGDKGYQFRSRFHEVSNLDKHAREPYAIETKLPYSFAPPAIVQNAAKEALEVVEANQYRYIFIQSCRVKKTKRLSITL